MKKLLLLTCILCSFFAASAQNNLFDRVPDHGLRANAPATKKTQPQRYGKAGISGWYSTLALTQADTIVRDSLQSLIGFMQHDSLAKIIHADGSVAYNPWLSIGRVLDPKDTLFDITDTPSVRLTRYASYTLDSVSFPYVYVRHVDSIAGQAVIDTLLITYFTGSNISKYIFTGSQDKYAIVDWQGDSIRMPQHYAAIDTVLLTSTDSTLVFNSGGGWENSFATKLLLRKAPAGLTVSASGGNNSNNLVAYTLTFKPGVSTVSGTDTAVMIYGRDPATLPAGTRRTNYFGFAYSVSTAVRPWKNSVYYNTSLLAPSWAAYAPYNSWSGYVPGNAFNQAYFIDADFHLSSDGSLAVTELNSELLHGYIVPNPAHAAAGAALRLRLQDDAAVQVSILNLLGQEITTMSCTATSGEQEVHLPLHDVKPGMYLVKIVANGIATSRKLLVE